MISRLTMLAFSLLTPSLARAEAPCAAIPEAASPALHLLQLGATEPEMRLQLELQLLLDGECLIPLPFEDPDFHNRSLTEQQAALAPTLPEAAMVLWIDTTDDQVWRIMLLTGGAPRTVLRVVEGAARLDEVPDLAMAVAETLKRIQNSSVAPPPPVIAAPEPEPEPELEPMPSPEPTQPWSLSLAPRLSQSLAIETGPGQLWGGQGPRDRRHG